ncbi:aminotransferase class I/II-fold pyridoxal phosphate-dependent enzyme [Archangium sp.]|uniref:aminotransferase class I/II-fold pyridoxal phosphate-dependent enzyme n=1 Tax=Archangium sp. TaxID=1872627 RepID=UPI002D4D46C1|nr:aminotransferase class I/II-fold pyridoxal phosphate-dependent enzyme [Archangium sp.]HYO52464.1 aminotransferase class I/II-fold pyridoxal phosphate-dependent enzyme [Archangium sp.]
MKSSVAHSDLMPASSRNDLFGLRDFHQKAVTRGYLYEIPVCEGVAGSHIRRGHREIVNFASISFMGFQEDPAIVDYFCEASRQYGLVTGGSRVTQGVCVAHAALEDVMNRITGHEHTVTFGSGLLANIGFLNAMTIRFGFDSDCLIDNQDTAIIMDRDCHWSLWKGAAHLEQGKTLFSFRHNDPTELDAILSRISSPKKVVVFESIYSSDGSMAPIGALLDVCEKHGALSYVDDANGFMIYGPPNRPYHAEYQELGRATFRMVSFSKAVGLEGGAISGPRGYVQPFEALSGTSLFTASMQPPTAATAVYILEKLNNQPELMDNYLAKVAQSRERLLEEGFQLYDSESYILSVFVGQDLIAENVRQFLGDEGFAVPVFRYPAVRRNHAVIRLILNDRHSTQDIENFIAALREARQQFGF